MTDDVNPVRADLHAQAVAMLSRRLPGGLPHPGDPSQLMVLPGFATKNMPDEMADAIHSMIELLCEAMVSAIETELDVMLIRCRPPGRYVMTVDNDGGVSLGPLAVGET